MSSRWAEGIDFEVLQDQKVKCLHCNKVLESKAGLGPHLSRCVKPSGEAPPSTSGEAEEFGLDEKENFINVLRQFGIKYAGGIAGFVEGFGFQNLDVIDEALRLSQVNPDKRKLIIQYWANHLGKPVPPTLIQKWSQPSQIEIFPSTFQNQPSITREEVLALMEQREKEREVERLKAEIQELRQQLSEGNPRKSEVEEIKKLLLEKERNEILDRLSKLEGYVMGGISNPYAFLGLVTKEVADVIKSSPLRHYILTGQLPSPPKEVEEGANEAIFSKLDKRYVVEE